MLRAQTPIDEIQGYLFSKPVSGELVRSLLDKRQFDHKAMLNKLRSVKGLAA